MSTSPQGGQEYAALLIDPVRKRFAVRPAGEKDRCAVRVSTVQREVRRRSPGVFLRFQQALPRRPAPPDSAGFLTGARKTVCQRRLSRIPGLPGHSARRKRAAGTRFQVVRQEFFSHTREPMLTFSRCRIHVNAVCLTKFEGAMGVQVLIDQEARVLALRPGQEGMRDVWPWCGVSGGKRRPRQTARGTTRLWSSLSILSSRKLRLSM